MSENTVAKYVAELQERHLIRTERTMIRTKDGRPHNGALLYNIRPIQEAVDYFHDRQRRELDESVERQRIQAQLLPPCSTQALLSADG